MVRHQELADTQEDQLSLAAIHYLRSHFQEATDIYKRLLLEVQWRPNPAQWWRQPVGLGDHPLLDLPSRSGGERRRLGMSGFSWAPIRNTHHTFQTYV